MSRSASPIDLPDDRIVIDRLLEKLQIVHRRIYRMEAAGNQLIQNGKLQRL